MLWYITRRVAQFVPVFLGATLMIYAMVFALPGDPVTALFGDRPITPGVAAAIRTQYHLDQNFLVQYLLYLKGVITLDFGDSFSGRPVLEVMRQAFPVSVKLAFLALALEAIFGIGFGLVAGLLRGGFFDGTLLIASLLVIAVPVFVLGFVLQFVIGVRLGWVNPTVGGDPSMPNLLLPAIVLGATSFAYVLRLTRTSVAETMTADFVRTASAKGLSRKRVILVHVLRNSLIPVVTFLGADLGALMGSAIVIEGIFNVPGIGNVLYTAVKKGEAPTVVSIVTILIVVFMLANLLVDLVYAVLDPRIRYA